MKDSSDDDRYVRYLQEQMMPADWGECFEPARWTRYLENLEESLLQSSDEDQGLIGKALATITASKEHAEVESVVLQIPTTEMIFRPIFTKVMAAAASIGLEAKRSIRLVTSTDVCASPTVRPSDGEHLLFIGLGTSSFCNYWAKAFAAIMLSIADVNGFGRTKTSEDVTRVLNADPRLAYLVARLGIGYAKHGTLMNFGVLRQPERELPLRLELLDAMETFVVAHEVAHIFAEEKMPRWNGVLEPEESRKLELFCDGLGIMLTRLCGANGKNYSSFVGVGALLSFRAIEFSAQVKMFLWSFEKRAAKSASPESKSHPEIQVRIEAIRAAIDKSCSTEERESVLAYFDEFDLILRSAFAECLAAMFPVSGEAIG